MPWLVVVVVVFGGVVFGVVLGGVGTMSDGEGDDGVPPDVLSELPAFEASPELLLAPDDESPAFLRSASGLNGSRCLKVLRFELCDAEESTSTAGSVGPLATAGAGTGAGVPSDAGLSITIGMATAAARSPRATGHSRRSRRSCQRSRKKVIARSPLRPGAWTRTRRSDR